MKILVNATNKGGEGKTMLTIILAEYLGFVMNKKVLILDLDPQANLSKHYLNLEYDPYCEGGSLPPVHPMHDNLKDTEHDGRYSVADIFSKQEVLPYSTNFKNIEIIPAYTKKLESITPKDEEEIYTKLEIFSSLPDVMNEYEVIIVDTQPSRSLLTKASIRICTHLLIPSQMEMASFDGIYGMVQLWKKEVNARAIDKPIKLIGILANKVRDVSLHKTYFESLKSLEWSKDYLIDQVIRERILYGELRSAGQNPKSIFEFNSCHPARKECEDACKVIVKKLYAMS